MIAIYGRRSALTLAFGLVLVFPGPSSSLPQAGPPRAASRLAAVADTGPGSATVDGVAWVADRSLAVTTSIGSKPGLNLNLFRGQNPLSRFGFTVLPSAAGAYVGSYDIVGAGGSLGTYTPDQLNPDILTYHYSMKGKLSITAYDAAKKTVSGTFSGIATNHAGGKPVTVENGIFHDLEITVGP